VDIFVQVSVGC